VVELAPFLAAKPLKMHRIFIDGQAGTTGLQIHERLSIRTDIELIEIDPAERKNPDAKQSIIDQADVVVLCLPDDAAMQTVQNTRNSHTRFIDASTAHRVNPDWAYGMPELMPDQRDTIASARLVSNPGCYPTGFLTAVKPLIRAGVLSRDALISISAISGYSGGGRQLIEKYESEGANWPVRPYGLTLKHKHVPEMAQYAGLSTSPVFMPTVGHFYNGMLVSVPIHREQLVKGSSIEDIQQLVADQYEAEPCINVMPLNNDSELQDGFLDPESANGTNRVDLFVYGHDDQMMLIARLDNLGKGAAGAAVQNLNLMLQVTELEGLSL
jgi:N-acetyl-gamma-glutamyl-phosphate reductase